MDHNLHPGNVPDDGRGASTLGRPGGHRGVRPGETSSNVRPREDRRHLRLDRRAGRGSIGGAFASRLLPAGGFDLNANNVAIVAAGGKTSIPLLFRAFHQVRIPCYVVFDADRHEDEANAKADINDQIIELTETEAETFPPTTIGERCTIWEEEFERTLRAEVADYEDFEEEAGDVLGRPGKGTRARYCALKLTERGEVPPSIRALIERIRDLATGEGGGQEPALPPPEPPPRPYDDIPF